MGVAGCASGKCEKPHVRFSNKIASDNGGWLVNLVSRSVGFTKAAFGGCFTDECEHLAINKYRLIDYDAHLVKVAIDNVSAISNVRFGYEDEDEGDGEARVRFPWEDDFDDIL
jgi:hypothetical protein